MLWPFLSKISTGLSVKLQEKFHFGIFVTENFTIFFNSTKQKTHLKIVCWAVPCKTSLTKLNTQTDVWQKVGHITWMDGLLTWSSLSTDPWCDSSHESQAYAQALRLYQQDKGCYESWEKLLGTEEQVSHLNSYNPVCLYSSAMFFINNVCVQVLASQVMEEVLPWLHNQLQTKVKGKKTERIRQWLAVSKL